MASYQWHLLTLVKTGSSHLGGCHTPGQNPSPFLCEGISWTKGSADMENEVIECQGVSPLYSSGMMSQVGGFMWAANPTSYVQDRLSYWSGKMAIAHQECDTVPQIHSLDASGNEGVLWKKQTEIEMLCAWHSGRHIVGTRFTCVIELRVSLRKNTKHKTTNSR